MDWKRTLRPVFSLRVVGVGIAVGFLLDVFGRALAVFLSGKPATFENIAALHGRPFHAASWVVSLVIFLFVLTYVVGWTSRCLYVEYKESKRKVSDE